MSYCSNCGNKLSDKDLFCTACGQKITQNQSGKTADLPKADHLKENKSVYSSDPVYKKKNTHQQIKNKGFFVAVFVFAFLLFTAIGIYMLFGERLNNQISNIFNPGVTVSFEARIPDGATTQEKTANMNLIADITRHRLKSLGYSNASVSVDDNIITVKNIPKHADINALTNLLTETSYTAEFWDSDSNIILTNAGFASATAKAGVDPGTKYQISIYFTPEALETFSEKIKIIAALNNNKNYIVLVVNGRKIVNVLISSEHAQTGWETNGISFGVTNNGYQFDLTPEELEKALNSGGALPYVLTNIGAGGTTTTGFTETLSQDTPKIDLQKLLDEGKTLSEIFDSLDGTNHYNYSYLYGIKYEIWVKGDRKKLVSTLSSSGQTTTVYIYGGAYYVYTPGIAMEMDASYVFPAGISNIDAWEFTRRFFHYGNEGTYYEFGDVDFVNIGSDIVNGEECTVFNVTTTDDDLTYRVGRVYISNNYGCVAKYVRILMDKVNEELKSIGKSYDVTEELVVEFYGLRAYDIPDSDVNIPEGTQIAKKPMG